METEQPQRTEEQLPDPLAEVLALDSGAIAKWAGKPGLRAAAELLAEAVAPEIRRDGAALAIRLSPEAPEVRYLAGQGLDGMVSKATRARLKPLHAAAVLAVRRAHGVEEAAAVQDAATATSAGPEPPDSEYVAQVRRTLEDAVFTALNQAPLVLEERLFTLSISSRADAPPRLGRQLRQLAAAIRQKREREFAFSPADALSLLAGTHALAEALSRPQPADRLAVLKGAVRQDYEAAGSLTLLGLDATLWRTRTGARGVTGYFYAPERQRILTASLARSSERDASFDSARAYDTDRLWNAAPLRQLIRSKVHLAGGGVSPDGRVSLSEATRASVEPWLPARETCWEWPVTFADWMALQTALRVRFDASLAGSNAGPVNLVLVPTLHAKATFDAIAQEYTWGVADAAGQWIGLSLPHDEARSTLAARLQRISELGDVHLVLAEARLVRSGFALQAIAVVARMPSVGTAALLNLDLESGGTELPSPAMRADWLTLVARRPEGAPPVLALLAPVGDRGATAKLLAQCAAAVLTVAELGTAHGAPEQRARLVAMARQLEGAGLLPLADAIAGVAGAGPDGFAAALLRAVHVLDRMRAHARQLAWSSGSADRGSPLVVPKRRPPLGQSRGGSAQVVLHEGGDEEVRVIVAFAHVECQRNARSSAGGLEQPRPQPVVEEPIGGTLIDQELLESRPVLDQRAGIVAPPRRALGSQILLEGRPGPAGGRGLDDRGERGAGAEAVGVLQGDGQRAVPAHGMAENPLPPDVCRKFPLDQRRQLRRHVGVHPIVLRVWLLRGVEIEARTGAELPVILLVRNVRSARAGVGADHDQAQLGGGAAVLALLHDVGMGACQAGEIPDDRQLPLLGLRRHEHREGHVARARLRGVLMNGLHAAERLRLGDCLHRSNLQWSKQSFRWRLQQLP